MKELTIFDNPKNIKRLLVVFYVILAILLAAEFFIHKHGDFPWEDDPGFFAVYGFLAYVGLIYVSKGLRLLVKRNEDYYDRDDDPSQEK